MYIAHALLGSFSRQCLKIRDLIQEEQLGLEKHRKQQSRGAKAVLGQRGAPNTSKLFESDCPGKGAEEQSRKRKYVNEGLPAQIKEQSGILGGSSLRESINLIGHLICSRNKIQGLWIDAMKDIAKNKAGTS